MRTTLMPGSHPGRCRDPDRRRDRRQGELAGTAIFTAGRSRIGGSHSKSQIDIDGRLVRGRQPGRAGRRTAMVGAEPAHRDPAENVAIWPGVSKGRCRRGPRRSRGRRTGRAGRGDVTLPPSPTVYGPPASTVGAACELEADDDRVVVGRAVRTGVVERVDLVRRLELDVVVEHGRLVGVDVPVGRAGRLRRERARSRARGRGSPTRR